MGKRAPRDDLAPYFQCCKGATCAGDGNDSTHELICNLAWVPTQVGLPPGHNSAIVLEHSKRKIRATNFQDTTFKFTRIAKNLGYRDQWKLRRIYNAIAASTEFGWSTEISPNDYKLCKNKAVSLAGIVIKVIPVYYDYMHKKTVDYCFECP